ELNNRFVDRQSTLGAAGDTVFVADAAANRVGENRGVRGDPYHVVRLDRSGQGAALDAVSREVIEPDADACVGELCGVGVRHILWSPLTVLTSIRDDGAGSFVDGVRSDAKFAEERFIIG